MQARIIQKQRINYLTVAQLWNTSSNVTAVQSTVISVNIVKVMTWIPAREN